MSVRSLLPVCLLALVACGGDSGGTPDAPKVDAKVSQVMEVTCPGNPAANFITQGTSFNPPTASISVGQIARFESNSVDHPIGPIPADPQSDPGLVVPATQTKCFMFLAAGTYKFRCTTHMYAGTLTVN